MSRIVAVFGSARVAMDSAEYQDSLVVGRLLGQAGFTVMTGGYDGVMGAASQGAAEFGAHVIGVTVKTLSMEGERLVNPWVKRQIEYPTMRERLTHLINYADAYVVMPGGLGTLQELAEAWQLMRIGEVPLKPLIAYGMFWRTLLQPLNISPYVPADHAALLEFVDTPTEVLDRLNVWKWNGVAS